MKLIGFGIHLTIIIFSQLGLCAEKTPNRMPVVGQPVIDNRGFFKRNWGLLTNKDSIVRVVTEVAVDGSIMVESATYNKLIRLKPKEFILTTREFTLSSGLNIRIGDKVIDDRGVIGRNLSLLTNKDSLLREVKGVGVDGSVIVWSITHRKHIRLKADEYVPTALRISSDAKPENVVVKSSSGTEKKLKSYESLSSKQPSSVSLVRKEKQGLTQSKDLKNPRPGDLIYSHVYGSCVVAVVHKGGNKRGLIEVFSLTDYQSRIQAREDYTYDPTQQRNHSFIPSGLKVGSRVTNITGERGIVKVLAVIPDGSIIINSSGGVRHIRRDQYVFNEVNPLALKSENSEVSRDCHGSLSQVGL